MRVRFRADSIARAARNPFSVRTLRGRDPERNCRRLSVAQAANPLVRARLLRFPAHRRHRRNAALPLLLRHHGAGACAVLLLLVATGMSTTIGYHRLFAHGTFKAGPVVRFVLLLFGAATFEESAMKWSSQHRQHHMFTDTEHDPYGVNKGFWHAHIGWILFWRHRTNYNNVKDLRRSRLVAHQHDHHAWWSVGGGIVLPMLIAWWIGHPLGGFVMSVCLRIVIVLHSTFCVNSFAHTFGTNVPSRTVGVRQLAECPAYQRGRISQFPPPLPRRLSQRHPLVSLGSVEVVHLPDVQGRARLGFEEDVGPEDCVGWALIAHSAISSAGCRVFECAACDVAKARDPAPSR